MTRPSLAYVVNSLHPGGTEKLVVEMALAFAGEFEVHVFCLDEPGHWAGDVRSQGIPVQCLWREPGLDVRMAWRLAKGLRACGARIVHAHQCTPWFYAALARLLYGQPRLLLEEHGRFYPEVDHRARRIVNRLLIAPLTERFVAVSADVRQRLVRYEGLDARRIEVIHNGVAPEPRIGAAERDAQRREWGFGADDFIVGTVGRFDPIKNLPMLVRSLAAARARDGRVRGLLVGDGPELPAVRTLIAELGLTEAVRLTGFRDDARMLVQCMDLFVLSSFSEGISMALLEAVRSSVPVAVTAVGGNPEIVKEGETGWVVPSGDIGSLTAVVLAAAGDPERCRGLARAGLCRFEEQFTFERMIAAYRRVYQSLLGPGKALAARGGSAGAGA
jgi:glycosyltransferase involved in cell wall biosynthesis